MIRTIGVIGGGQLGRMFALEAKRMGFEVVVLDPQEHSPCGQVADEQIVANYDDMEAIDRLGQRTDVVTYEFENIAIASVEYLEQHGYRVTPSSDVLRITQDRLLEKTFVRSSGIATTDFAEINRLDDLAQAGMSIGFPAILKTVRGGYDGKGQWRVTSLDEARAAFSAAKGAKLIYERVVPFVRELSIVATRDANDKIVCFAPGENTHDRGILTMTVAPARINDNSRSRARTIATTIGRKLGIVGTYCVELFLQANGDVLVNEIAPRPHNSGHYTIDVTQCSQYEQHVRAICDLPLVEPKMLSSAIMMNILGAGKGDHLTGEAELLSDPSIVLHMYGKHHAIDRRKMGHFTMLVDGPIDEPAIARAKAAHAKLGWQD
ncbi:MAG: 5-(carboxyamino)imidazole ribonucleotide synthase [Candidatus Aquilonibacter sp.]